MSISSQSYLYTTIVYTIFTCTYAINQLPTNFNDQHTSNLSQLSALRYEQLLITPLYGLVIRSARWSDAAQIPRVRFNQWARSIATSWLSRDSHVTASKEISCNPLPMQTRKELVWIINRHSSSQSVNPTSLICHCNSQGVPGPQISTSASSQGQIATYIYFLAPQYKDGLH